MQEEKHQELGRPHRLPGAGVRYADIEARKGKPGNGTKPKPKHCLPGKPS
jgi:hypothetical protein